MTQPPTRTTRKKPNKWIPTNKWFVQLASSLATVATLLWTGDGINTDDEKKAVIGLVTALILTYLTPNRKE